MMRRFTENASRIFLACGPTDFRKQIPGLIATVTLQFDLDPYNGSYVLYFVTKREIRSRCSDMTKTDLSLLQKSY